MDQCSGHWWVQCGVLRYVQIVGKGCRLSMALETHVALNWEPLILPQA